MEEEIRNGHHGTMPLRTVAASQAIGALFSNAHMWANRVKDAFDPQRVSNPF